MENNQAVLLGWLLFLMAIVAATAINVGTSYNCKIKSIEAGYTAPETAELCK